jgi:hypothetical protein
MKSLEYPWLSRKAYNRRDGILQNVECRQLFRFADSFPPSEMFTSGGLSSLVPDAPTKHDRHQMSLSDTYLNQFPAFVIGLDHGA